MSDDLKKVGIVFTADGAVNFNKTLKEVNAEIQENRSAFRLAKTEWNKSTTATQKLRTEQEYLQKQTQSYTQKVQELTDILEQLESAEKRDETAISKTKQQLANTKATLNNYEKGLKDVNKQLDSGAAQLQEYSDKIGSVGKKMSEVGDKMTRGVTTPILAVGAAAVTAGASFESSMSQVQATMGITKDSMSKVGGQSVNTMDTLSDLAKEMGETTAFSASECAEALNYLALAGYNTEEMTETLPTVLNLAAAGNIDLASASDMVTDAMSALGMGTDEADTMVDQMAKTASSTNTSVAQLGEGILTIGATAKTVKGGTAELNTALGILANNGIKGAEGGTHLRNIILALQNPSDKAAACLKSLGVSVYDSEGNMRSLNDILGDLNASMGDMTEEEKAGIIGKIFNKTDLSSVNALLANTGSTWDDLQQKITDSSGAAQQMADTQLDNLKGQLTLLLSAVEGLAISIGEILMPTIKRMVEGVQKVVDGFNSMDEGSKKTIVTIALMVAAIGPVLSIIGRVASGISFLLGIGAKIAPLLGAIATPAVLVPALVIAGIVAVVAIVTQLWKHCEGFRNFWTTIWNALPGFLFGAVGKIESTLTNLGNMIGKLPETVKAKLANMYDTVNTLSKEKLGQLLSLTSARLKSIKSAYSKAGGGIKGVMAAGLTAVRQCFQDSFSFIDTLTSGKLSNVLRNAKAFFTSAKRVFKVGVAALKGAFKFSWELPKIKLPHFKINGNFSLNPPTVPSFNIEWYAKGGILNRPTIFGSSGDHLLGGGEAGEEAVLPISTLKSYMAQVSREVGLENNRLLLEAFTEAMGPVLYQAFVKALSTINPSIILDDEKIGEWMADYLRREVFG